MFDISLSELGIVTVIALLVLGPKEFTEVVKFIRRLINSIKAWWSNHSARLEDIITDRSESDNKIVKYIIDLEGNMQAAYDLSSIMPEIKDKKNTSKSKVVISKKRKRLDGKEAQKA